MVSYEQPCLGLVRDTIPSFLGDISSWPISSKSLILSMFSFLLSWLTILLVHINSNKSFTIQRKRLATKIDLLGFPIMASCSQYITSSIKYIIQKSSRWCSSYTKKNISYDSNFSNIEFDLLETQKRKLFNRKMEIRLCLTKLAQKLLATQKKQDKLNRQLKKIYQRQEKMVELEARALKALDEITLAWLNLVLLKSLRLDTIPSDPIALISNIEFSQVDSKIIMLLQDSSNILK